jgi:hypothetical protein
VSATKAFIHMYTAQIIFIVIIVLLDALHVVQALNAAAVFPLLLFRYYRMYFFHLFD